MPDCRGEREGALDYEELLAGGDAGFEFPDLDENAAAAMCYTSGTTGRPKGVVYSHRSTVLHALARQPGRTRSGSARRDTLMPVVPMFHAIAWGMPYAAAMAGARQVLPGPAHDPAGARRADRRRARDPHRAASRRSGRACSSSIRRPTSRACAR